MNKEKLFSLPTSPESILKRRNRLIKPIAALAIAASAFFGGKALLETYSTPTFSEETQSYTFDHGEGLDHAAFDVEGNGSVDIRDVGAYIMNMEENKDAFEDGIQVHERITIPERIED